jgi:hypothetical protein
MKRNILTGSAIIAMAWCLITSCLVNPRGGFVPSDVPPSPAYGDLVSWAARPETFDSADVVPAKGLEDRQDTASADVFYIYPTTYIGRRGQSSWNASIYDTTLNLRTDKVAVRHQASIFNAAGRIYAPRYRQAHLESFYTRKKREDAQKALDLAYADVRKAFTYYLEHENRGRPFIIAAHSQGTVHAARLLKEFVDGRKLQEKLIVAYLVGMPVKNRYFDAIPVCETPEQTGCFCSWRTVKEGFKGKRGFNAGVDIVVTNPLSWSSDTALMSRELHTGALLRKYYDGLYPEFVEARARNGFLYVSKPRIPGVPILFTRNYHIADFNFFYLNVRENARLRVKAYLHRGS